MTLSELVAPTLPLLRRYARALTGSQDVGDARVVATIEALAKDPGSFPASLEPRAALYSVFHRQRSPRPFDSEPVETDSGSTKERSVRKRLAALTPQCRQALLLTTLEGFSQEAAAAILETDPAQIAALVADAVAQIERQTTTSVLIIEDEPLIAMDLEQIVRSLGHQVVGPVDTRDKASRMTRQSDFGLVLADIQLADGSSGVDAVTDILESFNIPVIFITAYPERLLTGERPEPVFIISKPFQTDIVKTTISQALFFEQTARLPD